MSLKTKVTLGLVFLYANILALGILGLFYISRISTDAQAVLKDNYNSLEYSNAMLKALDEKNWKSFEENLILQEKNITEKGEKEITEQLRNDFKNHAEQPLRQSLYKITELNQKAIHQKSTNTENTAKSAYMWLGLIGAFLFIIALTFIISFPSYVVNPVKRMMGDMQQVSEDKTNFIATVSHELKTPISSIKMSATLLENEKIGAVNEEQKELIKHIKDDSDRLLKITGELLDLGQIETGKIRLQLQKTDLKKVALYAIEAVKIQAEQKNIEIQSNADNSIPSVNSDPEKTAWVLINLLSNAIRYSPKNSKIIIELKRDKKKIICSVQDYGNGIEKQYRSKIFNRYFQIPGSSGTGLGLAISKEFIEAQGGEIFVESEIGEGSKFSFLLNVY